MQNAFLSQVIWSYIYFLIKSHHTSGLCTDVHVATMFIFANDHCFSKNHLYFTILLLIFFVINIFKDYPVKDNVKIAHLEHHFHNIPEILRTPIATPRLSRQFAFFM